MLSNWGRAIARRPKPVLIASGAMLLVSLAMLVRGGPLTTPTIDGIGWTRAQDLIEHDLGQPGQASFTLLLHADGVLASDPRFDRALHEQLDAFRADPRVQQVISPVDLPHPYGDAFISADQTHALALIAVKGTLRDVGLISEEIRGEFKPGLLKPTFTGYLAFKRDLDRLLEHDLIRAEIFAALAALRRDGEAVLIVDKNLAALRMFADRIAILEKGCVVWEGVPAALGPEQIARHLHV